MQLPNKLLFAGLFLAILIMFVLSLAIGSVPISVGDLWSIMRGEGDPVLRQILWQLRLPRSLAAILAGAALSLSGMLMQTFFRNPIAGPYVLGISSGAGLGAAIWIMGAGYLLQAGLVSASMLYNSWALAGAACLGAALVLILLLTVAWRIADINTLLILGLMLGSTVGSVVMLLQFFSGQEELQRFVFWNMGDLGGLSWSELGVLAPLISLAVLWTALLAQPLNLLLLGEDYAKSMGLNVGRLRWQLIILTSIMAGSITAFCGPIAFVGIAVPHLARMLLHTQRHQVLWLGTALLGVLLLLFCQFLAQLPFQDRIIPINAVTSLLGAPVVIWIVLSSRR